MVFDHILDINQIKREPVTKLNWWVSFVVEYMISQLSKIVVQNMHMDFCELESSSIRYDML